MKNTIVTETTLEDFAKVAIGELEYSSEIAIKKENCFIQFSLNMSFTILTHEPLDNLMLNQWG